MVRTLADAPLGTVSVARLAGRYRLTSFRDKDDNGMTTAMPTTAIIAATRNNPELGEWYGNWLKIR
jgi:hypothetical protein